MVLAGGPGWGAAGAAATTSGLFQKSITPVKKRRARFKQTSIKNIFLGREAPAPPPRPLPKAASRI